MQGAFPRRERSIEGAAFPTPRRPQWQTPGKRWVMPVRIVSRLRQECRDRPDTPAGALLGEPLEVVPGQGVDLAVPAHCEIVLEGVLHPEETVEEGPVSEFHGMYERYGAGHVVTFSHMTRRRDAVFQCVKLGIDATTSVADRSDWTRARPPDTVLAKVRERIARQLGGSSAATPGRPLS